MALRNWFSRAAPSAAERFTPGDAVVATQQAETTILMDLRSGRYYSLNPVGALVWSTLVEGTSMDGVMARVREEFDAPAEQLAKDVDEFVKSLVAAKLVRRAG